ncbi:MAG: TraB/GumN family protein, partial [Kofleriaceae bacterium]
GLDQQLSTDDWSDLRDTLAGVVKEEDLKRARPWFAMTRLTATVSPSPDPTMDVALAQRAGARGIPVDALESWSEQLAALADAVTVRDLAEAIRTRRTMACELDKLKISYLAGDQQTMQDMLVVPAARNLLEARNKLWLPKLERYATEGGAFVAVGLGHLLGGGSLIALLQADGYTVQRVAP